MTLPTSASKANMDAGTDDPKQARGDLANLVDKFNTLLTHVTDYTTIFNVRDDTYGAVVDGVTDDVVAIQAAVDAATAAGGGTVWIPGFAAVGAAVVLKSNVHISGPGWQAAGLNLLNSINTDVIQTPSGTTTSNVAVSGLQIDGNKANQTSTTVNGIHIQTTPANPHSIIDIRNNRIINCRQNGLKIPTGGATDIFVGYNLVDGTDEESGLNVSFSDTATLNERIVVTGNNVKNSQKANIAFGGGAREITISNNVLDTTDAGSGSGVGDNITGYSTTNINVTITGNTCRNSKNNGIHTGGSRIVVSNNVIFNTTNDGIVLSSTNVSPAAQGFFVSVTGNTTHTTGQRGIDITNHRYAAVIGNVIRAPTGFGIGVTVDVTANGCDFANVTGNIVSNGASTGIRFDGGADGIQHSVISSNVVENSGADGIRISDQSGTGCKDNIIALNRCVANTGWGILEANSSNRNLFVANSVLTNTAGGIILAGNASKVMDGWGDVQGTSGFASITAAASTTVPADAGTFVRLNHGSGVTVNNITPVWAGRVLYILFQDNNVTLAHAATGGGEMHLSGDTNKTGTTLDVIQLVSDGTDWFQANQLPSGAKAFNVVDHGAKGDVIFGTDGAITTGTPDFTSAASAFVAGDVGKVMTVPGAAAAGADLSTTILTFVSATAVTLAVNASTTVSSAAFDYGTDDTSAFQSAINAAEGKGTIFMPDGSYGLEELDPGTANLTFLGQSQGNTILVHRPGTGEPGDGTANTLFKEIVKPGSWAPFTNTKGTLIFKNFTVRGNRDTAATKNKGGRAFWLDYYDNITFDGIYWLECNHFATDVHFNSSAVWVNCRALNCGKGFSRGRDCFYYLVDHCNANHIGDDVVDCHVQTSGITETTPIRSGIVATNNHFQDCSGMKALGARNVIFANNTLERFRNSPITVEGGTGSEGDNQAFVIKITDNVITDSNNAEAGTPSTAVILIAGLEGVGTTSSSSTVPGYLTSGGTKIERWDFRDLDLTDSANPKYQTYDVTITGNIIARTLPAVTNYDDWGFGQTIFQGVFSNPQVTDAMMIPTDIIRIDDNGIRRLVIADNIFDHATDGIQFTTPVADTDYEQILIKGNVFHDITTRCVVIPSASINLPQFVFDGNLVNMDPMVRNSNSNTNGTYDATGNPAAISGGNLTGYTVSNNHFMHCCRMIATNVFDSIISYNNVGYCNPTALGFSTSNVGIGEMLRQAQGFRYVVQDMSPISATYLNFINVMQDSETAQPSAGTYIEGWFTKNRAALTVTGTGKNVLVGWIRLVTGTAHAAGTDWETIYWKTADTV